MKEEIIKKLEEAGFKRWQKNGMDRLYVNAGTLGLDCTYYKTGNIRDASFRGESISNSLAKKMKDARTYIDLSDDTVHSDNYTLKDFVQDMLEELKEVALYEEDDGEDDGRQD